MINRVIAYFIEVKNMLIEIRKLLCLLSKAMRVDSSGRYYLTDKQHDTNSTPEAK